MSELGYEVNLDDVESNSYDPVPAGWYTANITDAKVKTTSKGGTMIAMRFDIVGPSQQGRVVFTNINIINDNKDTEAMGKKILKSIVEVCGLPTRFSNTDIFVGLQLQIKVVIKEDKEYGPKNEVKGYQKAAEGVTMHSKTTASVNQQSTKPAGGSAPWMK